MRWYCLGISLFFLLNVNVVLASVSINEVAWPYTYFAIVLLITLVLVSYICVWTVVWQSRCLGKMVLTTFLLFFPFVSSATVSISEVAWMGSSASANHEWIELYNQGESISVDGWVLSDGMNLNINLSGTIAANDYAVLERTSEDSAPSTAFLIYTGAMVNTGATLTLRDGAGGIIDQVAGGENWQNIGGDNVTKETAQYTESGWVTDVSTPGTVNRSGRVTPPPTSTTTTPVSGGSSGSSRSGSSNKVVSVNLRNPETKLALKIEAQNIGYVNQLISFYVTPEGLDEKAQRTVFYEWNFGDSYHEIGRRVTHRYLYPGEYLVTVFGRKDKNEQTQTQKITILPVGFSLSLNAVGDVQIHNDTNYDVDISNFILKGTNEVIFPPRSVILAKATITVAASRLKVTNQDLVMLYDSDRKVVASTFSKVPDARTLTGSSMVTNTPKLVSSLPPTVLDSDFNFKKIDMQTQTEATEIISVPGENLIEASATVPVTNSTNVRWPYLALIGLILTAYIAVYYGRRGDLVTENKVT